MQLNGLDYCLISLILFSSLIGFARGLVQELSSIANWILGLWSGFLFYETAANILPVMIQPDEVRYILGFLMIFGIVLIAVTTLAKVIKWLVVSIGLKGPDAILGVVFGVLRGIAFSVLFMTVTRFSLGESNVWQSSWLINYLEPLEHWLMDFIPSDFI